MKAVQPREPSLLHASGHMTSFVAIAKGDVEADHWFRLGRALTPVGRGSALISWSGSMFEYLMPSLVMRAPAGSLLEQTSRLVVARQIRYGNERGVPWGISESGYNARDLMQAYQYSPFGVPGLAIKRGLSEDLVVAPYATALAAMVDPQAAVRNFARLRGEGGAGQFGFREALDYTSRRLPAGASVAVVHSYMPISTPDTSRATFPASARTAASTRTARSGRCSRSPASATGTRPVSCSRSSTP